MKKQFCLNFSCLLILFLVAVTSVTVEAHAQQCRPSGKIKGSTPPEDECNISNGAECCEAGKFYTTYKCSPPVSMHTKAILTINSFEKGGDGGAPSECDNKYHNDNTPVVALSTGWFSSEKRCQKFINIYGNGKTAKAMVVDECDSTRGCDSDHGYQPPCQNNIVDASKAVWENLGIKESDSRWGWMAITWSDA